MPQNFIECDSEQVLLMPPSLREWLPEDHFAWFVLAAVEEMDLSAFYAAYRLDGHGRAAHRSQFRHLALGSFGFAVPRVGRRAYAYRKDPLRVALSGAIRPARQPIWRV